MAVGGVRILENSDLFFDRNSIRNPPTNPQSIQSYYVENANPREVTTDLEI